MNRPRPFPLIRDLPRLVDTVDWVWERPPHRKFPGGILPEWWIGTDREARRWLVKMRGGFPAYREHVFAALAQRLDISCQSSIYILTPSDTAEPHSHAPCSEPWQLALWLMNEHALEACSETCALTGVLGEVLHFETISRAAMSGHATIEDAIRGDVLGHLCGQAEPHDAFFTCAHEYVVIDNELMFGGNPCLNHCHWLGIEAARPLIVDVCRGCVGVSDEELRAMAALPEGYKISWPRDLYDDLRAAKAQAAEYLDLFDDEIT